MSDLKRDILVQVKQGLISPEEAAARLEAIESAPPTPESAPPGDVPRAPDGPVERLRIEAAFRTARVVGDPTVDTVVVEGPHVVRRSGGALLIEGDVAEQEEEEAARGRGAAFAFSRANRPRVVIGLGSRPQPLTVRMNPSIPLEVVVSAGTLTVEGVRSEIRAEVSAGTVRIEGFASPLDVQVASGTVRASGVLDRGTSRVRCEAGSVRVNLERGSSVRVVAKAGLGKVTLPGLREPARGVLIGGGSQEAVVGTGAGLLEAEASIGAVAVTADA